MKDHRILPKVVLLEGVNLTGKSTLIEMFRERYDKEMMEVVKFPFNKSIVAKINFLYRHIERQDSPSTIRQLLETIHHLHDLDFRVFDTRKDITDTSRVYFLDRYFPSNMVYSKLHGVSCPNWGRGHCLKPDLVILLGITKEETRLQYVTEFPVCDQRKRDETDIASEIIRLNPVDLLGRGQTYYRETLTELEKNKTVEKWCEVEALQESTFRDCERILIRDGFL